MVVITLTATITASKSELKLATVGYSLVHVMDMLSCHIPMKARCQYTSTDSHDKALPLIQSVCNFQ